MTEKCPTCGGPFPASAQPAPAPQETAAEDAEDLADALAMEARYRARGVEGLRAYPLPTTTETLSDQGGYVAAPSPATTPHEEKLREFFTKLAESQVELPPECARILRENLWDLYG